MAFNRLISLAVVASAAALLPGAPAFAADLRLRQLDAAAGIPEPSSCRSSFKTIEKETNGAIKWKLIAGGQLADGKSTFTAIKDDLMQGGLASSTYVPNAVPSLGAIYTTRHPRP